MKIVYGAIALYIGAVACSAPSFAFSALGLRNALQNCLNKEVASDQRIEACNEAIHTNVLRSRDRARVITSRGNAYFASANFESALDDYNKAIDLNPQFPPALVNRGVTLKQLGKCDQAISDFSAALSLDPHLWEALYGRSVCEAKSGNEAKAQSDLAAATTINPEAGQEFGPQEVSKWYQ